MKTRVSILCAIILVYSQTFGGTEQQRTEVTTDVLNPQRFELAVESGYLFGAFNPPQDYQIGTEFITARVRWGVVQRDIWLRGYNQFYISAIAEPIFRGIENHYFGLNLGMRYNFVRPGSRFVPYISGGLGLGWIDSHPEVPGGQGQDFTFNILSAAGISYLIDDHWKISVGALYQHLSNGGQTDPNPSLNLFGPPGWYELFILIFPVMSSEAETPRKNTTGIATGFFGSAQFILSERRESNGLRSE